MSIFKEVQKDTVDFEHWSTMKGYSKERFGREMAEYVQLMVDDGKFDKGPAHGWDFGDEYFIMFVATDDNTMCRVVFKWGKVISSTGPANPNDAYDRAMKGI